MARKRRPGQFVIVRVHEEGERIPLTIADSSAAGGTVTLIVQGVGKTTRLMNLLEAGDALLDLVGPLGRPTEVERFGTVVVVGGGVGAAIAYPSAVALAPNAMNTSDSPRTNASEVMSICRRVRAASVAVGECI